MLKSHSIDTNLPRLPKQPEGVAWPTRSWQKNKIRTNDSVRFLKLCDEIFDLNEAQGVTYALAIVQGGELVYERYDAGSRSGVLQYSWSMGKSITQALVGILVRQGKLDIYEPAQVPEWQNDARREITLDQLLRMSSGLEFNEDYVDGQASDVIPMLQYEGRHDTGAFAANKPLLHKPGTQWSYSSGTTNIICRILKEVVGDGASGMLRFMNDELFEPIGIKTATPKFDTSGTFIGSSFLFATPRDFARFGLLYLRGGTWDGTEIVTPDWVDYARTVTYLDETQAYGAQWWMKPDQTEWFYSSGYDGQRILCVPEKDLVLVRCGRTPAEEIDYVWERFNGLVDVL